MAVCTPLLWRSTALMWMGAAAKYILARSKKAGLKKKNNVSQYFCCFSCHRHLLQVMHDYQCHQAPHTTQKTQTIPLKQELRLAVYQFIYSGLFPVPAQTIIQFNGLKGVSMVSHSASLYEIRKKDSFISTQWLTKRALSPSQISQGTLKTNKTVLLHTEEAKPPND